MASETDTLSIPLGPLDHIAPCNIPQSIIYLALKQDINPQDAHHCLYEGLRKTIIQVPWLKGRVHWQAQDSPGWRPSQLEIRYSSADQILGSFEVPLRFNELPKSTSYAELRDAGFPLDVFDEESLLWTSPFEPDFELGAEVFAAQANFIPGGCLLVLSIAPPASDGTAMLSVTKVWADHCSSLLREDRNMTANGVQSLQPLPAAGIDRVALDTIFTEARNSLKLVEPLDKSQLLEWRHLVGIDGPNEPNHKEASHGAEVGDGLGSGDANHKSDMKPRIFYMPQPMYAELRKEQISFHNTADVSGNDVIWAFIWRSILRAQTAVQARQHHQQQNHSNAETTDPNETATLAIPFDARPDLSHLLPRTTYLGNLNFEHILTLPLHTLISQNTSIAQIAAEIRTTFTRQSHPTALLEAYHLLRSVPAYNNITNNPLIRASHFPVFSSSSPSCGILSPMNLPFNGTCFGSHIFANEGRPEAFRPLMGTCNAGYRTCFIVPRKPAGGIEFVMMLSREEREWMEDDGEVGKYAFLVS